MERQALRAEVPSSLRVRSPDSSKLCNKGTALAGPQQRVKGERGFSPCHGASRQKCFSSEHSEPLRTFFVTTVTNMGRRLLQSERNAELLIDVLRSLVAECKFELHDFVIMPDHLHLLLTVYDEMTIEKAMQLIKGRFSHRLSHEVRIQGRGLAEGIHRSAGNESREFRKASANISRRIRLKQGW